MLDYQAPQDLLKDRVIIVTGAGQGIGKAAALSYAAHGATVIIIGRTVAKLEAVYDEIQAAGLSQAVIYPMDFEKAIEQDFDSIARAIYKQLGRLDGILHNAAEFDNLSPLEIQTIAQFEKMFKVNVTAPFALTKACLPLLKLAYDGSVIFTSSSSGQTASAYWGAHGVSKQAIEHMAQTWALELKNVSNMRINTIVPGAIQSPQRRKSHPGEVHDSLNSAESIMPLYLYLMGPESPNVTGRVFQAQA